METSEPGDASCTAWTQATSLLTTSHRSCGLRVRMPRSVDTETFALGSRNETLMFRICLRQGVLSVFGFAPAIRILIEPHDRPVRWKSRAHGRKP